MPELIVAKEVWIAIEEIATQIARDQPLAARKFIEGARLSFDFLSENPGAGTLVDPPFRSLPGLRFWPLSPCRKYLVFYLPRTSGVEILKVVHGGRDWRVLFIKSDEDVK